MFRALILGTSVGFIGLASPLSGQASSSPSAADLQRAGSFFTNGNWQASRDAYQALSASHPTHALSRFRVGVSQLELGDAHAALSNLREGERLGVAAPQAAFRLGQAFARVGQIDSALTALFRAAAAGHSLVDTVVQTDRHLGSLRAHPRWREVVAAFDRNARPCLHDQRFREFDFWVGDWDVRPTGQPAAGPPARNTVTSAYNGCVVIEHWKSPAGSEGESYNIFDRSIGKWRQTWVDNGEQHDYRGQIENGNMVFIGDTPAPNGQLGRVPTRLTFFRLGRDSVRQFSQTSSDSGKTWQTSYDLMYVRRRP